MNNHKRNISLVVADTQFLTNEALKSILSPLYQVVHLVSTKAGLMQYLQQEKISLVITDYTLFDFDSIDDLGEIRKHYPDMGIIILTNAITHIKIKELNDSGIKNIVLKTDDGDELFHAIEAALKGKKYYSGDVLDILLKKDGPMEDASLLTTSEIEIVRLIAAGLSTKEIAVKKHISFHTVMTHRKNIFRKLSVSSSPELMMYAIKAGLIDNIEYHI
ncbi:response regulator transcription factor [Chlorobium sp. BLA1]|uniref:LuxR C-terminal-related transcriptional regulator n=1 Tax=Candidatus Chlorobium masyuteum TaxID=2716876 RepID=UPI00141F9BC8|nr:response regulator transcription factor [Candidatus Chlorobium masyuteum]NHQ60200.1 response regulator transcription factor [Candidatus Chlorobium masyuteum]NTU44537.1 response regulator transcription factor [Chlorobiaceae bacterium]